MDLFEKYKKQPKELKIICNRYFKNELDYKSCESFLKECNKIGYKFEYGLNAEPFNLTKI